ncbi:MAG: hypothetical protein QXQ07_06795, partial [Thermoproteota archaeon]
MIQLFKASSNTTASTHRKTTQTRTAASEHRPKTEKNPDKHLKKHVKNLKPGKKTGRNQYLNTQPTT